MSRIGKLPIQIPSGVTITVDSQQVSVNGTKGNLSQAILPGINIKNDTDSIEVTRTDDQKIHKSNHGLMRTLIQNMVIGVSEGFSKKLEIHGVGYRVNASGNQVKLNVGFSHDVTYEVPLGISATTEQNMITISGIDKQQVGQVAAEIRNIRKPEPYKGKGIRYSGENIIRKSGKSGKDK